MLRPWKTDEVWLLPPSVADFVPAGHPDRRLGLLAREGVRLNHKNLRRVPQLPRENTVL